MCVCVLLLLFGGRGCFQWQRVHSSMKLITKHMYTRTHDTQTHTLHVAYPRTHTHTHKRTLTLSHTGVRALHIFSREKTSFNEILQKDLPRRNGTLPKESSSLEFRNGTLPKDSSSLELKNGTLLKQSSSKRNGTPPKKNGHPEGTELCQNSVKRFVIQKELSSCKNKIHPFEGMELAKRFS